MPCVEIWQLRRMPTANWSRSATPLLIERPILNSVVMNSVVMHYHVYLKNAAVIVCYHCSVGAVVAIHSLVDLS